MLNSLFQFFNDILANGLASSGPLYSILVSEVSINGTTILLVQYLAFIMAYISFAVIVVLCCLFVYKIIKLIGGLIR